MVVWAGPCGSGGIGYLLVRRLAGEEAAAAATAIRRTRSSSSQHKRNESGGYVFPAPCNGGPRSTVPKKKMAVVVV
jgi:NAD(P)-dependent dehydrogenase (short-subunit alcohol dehydrogenase family)